MNKEELLQKIKDEIANLNGHHKMEDCTYIPHLMALMEAVANRYAIVMCEAQKEACSDNADIHWPAENNLNPCVDKQSILNTKNVAE